MIFIITFTEFIGALSIFELLTKVGFQIFSLAVEDVGMSEEEIKKVKNLRAQLAQRQVWMASSIHRGEEEGYFLPLL